MCSLVYFYQGNSRTELQVWYFKKWIPLKVKGSGICFMEVLQVAVTLNRTSHCLNVQMLCCTNDRTESVDHPFRHGELDSLSGDISVLFLMRGNLILSIFIRTGFSNLLLRIK